MVARREVLPAMRDRDHMYCHACGRAIPIDSAFCIGCGAPQGVQARVGQAPAARLPDVLVVLALIFFMPIGVLLMWTMTDWNSDVKWAVSGLMFPPLWLRFLWKVPWLPYTLGGILAAVILQAMLFGGFSAAGGIALLTIIAVVLLIGLAATSRRPRPAPAAADPRRQRVADTLDACNVVIEEIEGGATVDALPLSSPERQRYMRALTARSTAQDLFDAARDQRDLIEAERQASSALRELKDLRDITD